MHVSQSPQQAAPAPFWKAKRKAIIILLFAAGVINYADRVNMSIAAPEIAKYFGWDAATMGIIMSSFLWSYVAFLVPMGWFTDRFGPLRVNSWGIGVWSAAAMLTGVVGGFYSMLLARLALGAGEATTWPSSGKIIRKWFPPNERGIITTIFQSGGNFGPAIAMPIVAWLVVNMGWRLSFVITGSIGFVWLILWVKYYREPEHCRWLPEEERQYILQSSTDTAPPVQQNKPTGVIPKLLAQKTVWGLAISQGCLAYTQYLILTWLPSYLVQAKDMHLMKASMFSAAAFLFATVVNILAGKFSDTILTPDKIKKGHRRTMVVVFMLMTLSVGLISVVDNHWLIFLMVGFAIAFSTSAIGLNMALTNDLVHDSSITGSVFGLLILGGNSFGMLAPILTGFMVKATGSFDSGFFLAGGILCLGAVVSLTLTRKPVTIQ